jgi:hypothetical protein
MIAKETCVLVPFTTRMFSFLFRRPILLIMCGILGTKSD